MKKTLLIIIFSIALIYSAAGQSKRFVPCPELNKFVGTWIYHENKEIVAITIKKVKIELKDISTEVLEGYHSYKIGEKTVENTNEITLKNGSNYFNNNAADTNTVTFSFFDSTKKKGGDVTIAMMPDKKNEIKWTISNPQGFRVHKPGKKEFDRTFTLPVAMVLKKQH